MTVGRSGRTPAKHDLMRSIVGREVGAAGSMTAVDRLVWFDLTAGDGITCDEGASWAMGCSPGIMALYATHSKKPVDLTLFEIKPATYDRLMSSLSRHLPDLGYVPVEEGRWAFGNVVDLRAVNGSGADASIAGVCRFDAVLVSNDPNAITDWAMRPSFAREISEKTPWFRSISTMGCNPAGLKRLPPDIRMGWFDLIASQENALPRYRDLLLAAIAGDDAQWAYLLGEPVKWRGSAERMATTAFRRHDYTLDMAWCRMQRGPFDDLKRRLFLTRSERSVA